MTDAQTWENRLRDSYRGLRSLLLARVKDAAVADDLLNEAIATALDHLREGRVSQPEKLGGYVYRTALFLLKNYRRHSQNRVDLRVAETELAHLPDPTPSPEAEYDSFACDVRALIADLPTARDREMVKRFYLDEEDKNVICSDLGLSPLHFDKVIFRARQRMRTLLEAKGYKKSDFFGWLLLCYA